MNTRQPWYLRLALWPELLVVGFLFLSVAAGSLLLYSTVRAGGLFRPTGSTATPTPPGPPAIELSISEGAPGTLVLVTGGNWSTDETVILSLDNPMDGRAPALNPDGLIAVGKATSDGTLSESFVYPSEDRWASPARVFVVARSQSTGQLATAVFRPLVPAATMQPNPTEAPPVIFPTALPTQTPVTACTDRLAVVADVTIPDSSNMQPARSFVKTWRIRNTGTCTWLPSYEMVFTGGSAMGAPSVVPLGRSVFPGDSVDLSLSLKAPSAAGTYRGNWMLRSASGGMFGLGANANQPFWVQIVIGPVGSTGDGTWKGEYHANRTLSGTPTAVRQDVVIDFDWRRGQPHADIPADDFSVRWTGKASFDAATYRFKVLADDGVRLWIDDVLVLDQWKDQSAAEYSVDVALAKGTHTLRLEYYERSHDARVRLRWERQPGSSFADWKGEYFANRDLNGSPVLVRNDRVVDYNWRGSGPAAGLPADNFSARWTRKISFQSGTHRFIVRADDGVRVYVDGQRIIDEWHDDSGKQDYVTNVTLSGQKTVVVEYYERAGNALVAFDIALAAPTPTPSPTPAASPSPTATAEPSPTPTSEPTATPVTDPEGGLSQVLDLGADVCAAEWRNDEGLVLSCPGAVGSLPGWVLVEGPTTLEDDVSYQGPVVAMGAGETATNTVSGRYPAREFGAGERFRARLGCPYGGTSCSYVFRLAYQDGGGDTHVLASWEETYDGATRLVDIDLAPLSGLTVALVLEVEALADELTASALWVRPRIVG